MCGRRGERKEFTNTWKLNKTFLNNRVKAFTGMKGGVDRKTSPWVTGNG